MITNDNLPLLPIHFLQPVVPTLSGTLQLHQLMSIEQNIRKEFNFCEEIDEQSFFFFPNHLSVGMKSQNKES